MPEEIPYAYPSPAVHRRPIAWVTWTIVGSTVAVFLLQLAVNHIYGEDLVGNALAFSAQSVAGHRYWTILTYAWVHATAMFGDSSLFWLHIVANMVPLACLGPALEELLGKMRFLGLYLGGAVAAALAWYVFDDGDDQGVVGASGAVFALVVAAGTAAPRARVMVYVFFVLPLRMSLRVLAISICAVEFFLIFVDWMPGVAHVAHLGGAAFGFLYINGLRMVAKLRQK